MKPEWTVAAGIEAARREGLRQLCARQGRNIPDSLLRVHDRVFPCRRCGVLRSEAEGGTVFTVCDDCWDLPKVTP